MTSAAARTSRHRWHAPERGTGPAFAISLGAHALLFLAIAFVVRWKTEPAGAVSAELWGGLPPMTQAAPQPVPAPPPPPPPPKVEPQPEPEPPKADITLEQKKPPPKVEPKKVEPPKKEDPPKKPEPDRKAEQRQREEDLRQQKAAEAAAAKQREAAIQRALAAAGPVTARGTGVAGGTGLTDSYKGQIVGCIRPHIAFSVPENVKPKQHVAEFEVSLLPTGEQAGAPRLVNGSGLAAFDQAVERAIRRCDPFPRPREGTMPRSVRLSFDPVDTR